MANKMGKLQVLLLLSFFCNFAHLQAYICSGDIWKKWNEQSQNLQYIYCFSDIHEGNVNLNHAHRAKFLNILSQFNKATTLVITEDPTNYTGDHGGITKYAKKINKMTGDIFIEFTCVDCKKMGYDVFNTECRHARLFSEIFLQELLEGDSWKPNNPINNVVEKYNLTPKVVVQECLQYLDEISSYNDGAYLNTYFKNEVARLKGLLPDTFSKMENYENYFLFFKYEFPSNAKARKFEFLYRLGLWGADLLNMRALHTIYNACDKKDIFVLMGAGHTYEINKHLSQLGYERAHSFSSMKIDDDLMDFTKEVITNVDCVFDFSINLKELQKQSFRYDDFNGKLFEQNVPVSELFWKEITKLGTRK